MLELTKGQTIDLTKADGTPASNVRAELSWDAQDQNGHAVDVDLFVHNKTAKTTAYFNAKTAIKGVKLGEDNLTGEGDGVDEYADFDATVSDDGEMFICINIYNGAERGQNLGGVKNLKVVVRDLTNNTELASYSVAENGGSNTGLVVAKITDKGNAYSFEAVGNFVNGDINTIVAGL